MTQTTASPTPRAGEPAGRPRTPVRAPAVIRSVLFPSDLSPASDRAFDHARFLAERFGARLTLYHAVEVPSRHGHGPWDPEQEAWRRVAKDARDHLGTQAARLPVETEVIVEREPSAHGALLAQIRGAQPDLTVMATHGREGLAHLFVGSVTERVMQHGRSPVLCVREPEHGVALPYRRILVPTDLSEASRHAFPLAALLARAFGAEVLALHVARVAAPSSLHGVSYVVEASPTEQGVTRFLEPDFQGVRLTPRVLWGSAWDRIAETAQTEHADLIVMSTHGHDSVTDRVIGSHAERVVRHAPCPVLIA